MALKWYGDQVLAEIEIAEGNILAEAAFQIEAEAKRNIVSNNQVDTGFLLNSTYTVTAKGSTLQQARGAAKARNPQARMGSGATVKPGQAAVAAGAEYAIYQEIRRSFLYKAGQSVARQAGGIITKHQLR